jgi:hypothetical protein
MIRELQQRVAKPAPAVPELCVLGAPSEVRVSPDAGRVAAEDVHADRDEINTMISEGGPAYSAGSVSIPGGT